MFVKICGITTVADARVAALAGADAIGLIMAVSPRRVDASVAADIVSALEGASLLTVGVFRGQEPRRIIELARATGVAAVQVHPRSRPDVDELRADVPYLIEAVPPHGVSEAADSPADLLLLDAAEAGSGRTFDWSLVGALPSQRPVLLAGGLTPDNVQEAIRRVQPYGVDVASGVEASPGVKDPEQVRRFVARAREVRTGSAGDVGS
jgi:phosphoribosylanthranilate isomerase